MNVLYRGIVRQVGHLPEVMSRCTVSKMYLKKVSGYDASETWVLTESMINKLMIFERKIMRKILGRTRSDDGYCRIKTNQEINDILKGQNITILSKNKD